MAAALGCLTTAMARRKPKVIPANPRRRFERLMERLEFLEDSRAALRARDDRDASVPWIEVRH